MHKANREVTRNQRRIVEHACWTSQGLATSGNGLCRWTGLARGTPAIYDSLARPDRPVKGCLKIKIFYYMANRVYTKFVILPGFAIQRLWRGLNVAAVSRAASARTRNALFTAFPSGKTLAKSRSISTRLVPATA